MSNIRVIKNNFTGLKNLVKGAKKKHFAKVGILGKNDARDEELGNAEIGAIHEFGSFSRGIPARSFLRMPLKVKSKQIIKQMNAQKKIIAKSLVNGDSTLFYRLLGIAAEVAIQEAFDTQGFGTWESLKHREGSPLIDTGQLRGSITSQVE